MRFGGLILEVCILLWLFLIPFLEKTLVSIATILCNKWFLILTKGLHSVHVSFSITCGSGLIPNTQLNNEMVNEIFGFAADAA